jgi:hypothetical protein
MALLAFACVLFAAALPARAASFERVAELDFTSAKTYSDPFNDVDLDVIFNHGGKSWRVPAFWRGGQRWTVRFAPPEPGTYTYRLESTDRHNRSLNGHAGSIVVTAYSGANPLLLHGPIRVNRNGRFFEQADGTPFYWLGETLYTSFSDRLPWAGFKTLIDDRKAKGFTVAEAAVMTVSNEETAPTDPGFCNEGGCVWDSQFRSINSSYFDYVDRRVAYLVDSGIAPALIGSWRQTMAQMGVPKLQKYWRYVIARYGSYPVFWIAGGEIYDPPVNERLPGLAWEGSVLDLYSPGWTEVMRYIKATDPYHHPLSVHEIDPPYDTPLKDEALKDFELFQGGHRGLPSLATEVALLEKHYARTRVRKPLVMGEIGWETMGAQNYEDYQRMAFWLAMLNGAAGFSYGNPMTGESYSPDKPFHRIQLSFLTWQEGMALPGSYQVGIGSKLLRRYPWEKLVPQVGCVTPHGTTLLEPTEKIEGFDIDLIRARSWDVPPPDDKLPLGEWSDRKGSFHQPYCAGIPGQLRLIYVPPAPWPGIIVPTVQDLEPDILYHAYYWEPSIGVKIDLGLVRAEGPGIPLLKDDFQSRAGGWMVYSGSPVFADGAVSETGGLVLAHSHISARDALAMLDADSRAGAALLFRFKDKNNYLAAVYSAREGALYLIERRAGRDGAQLGRVAVSERVGHIRLAAEVRGGQAIASLSDGTQSVSTPIVDVRAQRSGAVGIADFDGEAQQHFTGFEARLPGGAIPQRPLDRKLYDAEGRYRGSMTGPGWDDYAARPIILMNSYRPERAPFTEDWLLVLEKVSSASVPMPADAKAKVISEPVDPIRPPRRKLCGQSASSASVRMIPDSHCQSAF